METIGKTWSTFLFLLSFFCTVSSRDQRITQDVERFCDEVSQALPKLILQPFLIGYYSYKTFIRSGLLSFVLVFLY